MTKKFITTAIDYVNSLPHIGTAYEKIGADVLARFYRLQGDDVVFQMGNDEHSANVQKAAEAKGLDPKVYCDGMRLEFEKIWQALHISNDKFIQTSDDLHHKTVNEFFARVHASGDIYQKDYEGWYCESCEAFYLDKDLEAGLCKNHKTKPKWLKEKNHFFKLSRYADALLQHIEKNPAFVLPAKRRNEVTQFIKQGLEDFSISRSTFTWGIPVPIDSKHVFYVWFDALINYISLLGLKSLDELKKNECWKNVVHVVGKDITRFHCIIWPAMLLSAKLPLPKQILGHGFVYLKGEKMSKSLGNVVTPLDILAKYPDFGADALRYYLLRGSSFGDDGDFTWDGFISRYNADLANGFGNLVARTLGMVWRYQQGVVKPVSFSADEKKLFGNIPEIFVKVADDLNFEKSGDVEFHLALEKIWSVISSVDQYIDQKAPWTLSKEKKSDELSIVLTTLIEAIRLICVLIYPFIPVSAEKTWLALGFESVQKLKDVRWSDAKKFPFLATDHKMAEEKLMLFPRIQSS